MKTVTLRAEEEVIKQARQIARAKHTTLNQAFRKWLADYTARTSDRREYTALMRNLARSGVRAGRKFSREELNER